MPDQPGPSGDDWATPAGPAGPRIPQGQSPYGAGPPPSSGWANSPGQPPAAPSAAGGWANQAGQAQPGGWGPQSTGVAGSSWNPGATPNGAPGSAGNAGSAGGSSTGPPTWILLIGVIIPLATIPLLLIDGLALHIAGWLIAIFGSIGALAAFTAVDLRRRSSRWYVDHPGLLAVLRVAVLLTGLVVAGFFSYEIADVVARWDQWF